MISERWLTKGTHASGVPWASEHAGGVRTVAHLLSSGYGFIFTPSQ